MNNDKELLSLILRDALSIQQHFKQTIALAKVAVTNPTINFTPKLVVALHKATVEAGKNGQETFTFEGHEFVVGYAEYLLEHLTHRMEVTDALGRKLIYRARQMREARERHASSGFY